MKNMITKGITLICGLLLAGTTAAQNDAGIATGTFQVSGNCGMCKKTIENAALINGVKTAQWNEKSKVLTVKYNRSKTTSDEVLRKVASAGYDNVRYVAPDQAYHRLHGCCQYERQQSKENNAVSNANHQETIPQTRKLK